LTVPLLPPAFLSRLSTLEVASRRPLGVLPGGGHGTGRGGAGTVFREHRPYSPGDDLRYVDWSASGRHGRTVTKRFEAEEAARVVLALDASGSMGLDGGRRLRAAARALLVAGAVALGRGDTVHLTVLPGGTQRAWRGRRRTNDLRTALEVVRAEGRTDLATGLRRAAPSVRGRAMLLLASDFLDPKGACAGVDAALARGWEVRALHPMESSDLDAPPAGAVVLVDAETGEEREFELSEEHRERLAAAARGRVRALRDALRRRGVPWVRLPMEEDAPGAVLTALRRAGVLA
jgi:uncharacterized protein (DUF58 family)